MGMPTSPASHQKQKTRARNGTVCSRNYSLLMQADPLKLFSYSYKGCRKELHIHQRISDPSSLCPGTAGLDYSPPALPFTYLYLESSYLVFWCSVGHKTYEKFKEKKSLLGDLGLPLLRGAHEHVCLVQTGFVQILQF